MPNRTSQSRQLRSIASLTGDSLPVGGKSGAFFTKQNVGPALVELKNMLDDANINIQDLSDDLVDLIKKAAKLDTIETGAQVNATKNYWNGYDGTGGLNINTTQTVNLTEAASSSDSMFALSSDQLQINRSGDWAITIEFTASSSGVSTALAWLETNTSGSFVLVTGSYVQSAPVTTSVSATGSATIITTLNGGDQVRIRALRIVGSTTVTTTQYMSRLTAREL